MHRIVPCLKRNKMAPFSVTLLSIPLQSLSLTDVNTSDFFSTLLLLDRMVCQKEKSLLLSDKARNIGFQVGWDRNHSGLADQELSLKVPARIRGAGLFLEELPDLGGCLALDFSQLHQDSGKVFRFGKFRNCRVVVEFLPTKLSAGESKNHEFVAVLLVEFLELCVLAVC